MLSCEILVVGLGPVGATLAALLGDAGMNVIAIDKAEDIYPLPRAAHFDHEIMRVFQQLGIADEVLQHARPALGYEFRSAAGEVLVNFDVAPESGTHSGWATAYMFNQPGLERALRTKLQACPHVKLRLGTSFESLQASAAQVVAQLSSPQGPLTVQARYLIGCDGAWSPVREACGIRLQDLKFDEPWLVIDAIPRPGARLPPVNLQICDPARPTTCIPMGPGRHRWEFMMLPGERAEDVLQNDFIENLLTKWETDVEIERKAVYRFHGLVADKWRDGRVLIAGDSAHQTPPFAGQGMCAGIRDAVNLAWKLRAVLRGQADDTLLDSYQEEREPNTRAYIQLAIDMGRVVCTLDPVLAKARDEQMLEARRAGLAPIPPAAPPAHQGSCRLAGSPAAGEIFPQPLASHNGETIRLDDALGSEAWLLTTGAPPATPPGMLPCALADRHLAPFRAPLTAWLAAHQAEAVLVRPDRYVFGTGTADALLQAWAAALRPAALS